MPIRTSKGAKSAMKEGKSNTVSDLFLPPMVSYRMAQTRSHEEWMEAGVRWRAAAARANSRNTAGMGPNTFNHYGNTMQNLHLVLIVGDEKLLEVCVRISHYPSFCGGAMLHSPQVNLIDFDSSWNGARLTTSGPVVIDSMDAAIGADVMDVRDALRTAQVRSNNALKDYGYRILANSIAGYMISSGKKGLIFSGTAEGECSKLAQHLYAMTKANGIQVAMDGTVLWDYPLGGLSYYWNDHGQHNVDVSFATHTGDDWTDDYWMNTNSGNKTQFFSALFNYDKGPGERPHVCTEAERQAYRNCWKTIRRYAWTNG